MAQILSEGGVKPTGAPPTHADDPRVPDEWKWFFEELAFAFVYWDGFVFSLRRRAQPNSSTIGNLARTRTNFGLGVAHSGRGEFDSFSPLNPGTGGVTLLTYANANATDRQTLVCQRVGNQDNHLELRAGQKFESSPPTAVSTVSGHLFFQCDDGSTNDAEGASTDTTTPIDGEWHAFAGRRTPQGETSVWSDGEDVTGFNQTDNTEDINDTGTFVLGGLPGTSTIAYQDDKLLDVGWNRAISDGEMRQIGQHPLGWFRPRERDVVQVLVAADISNDRLADMGFCRGAGQYGPGRLPVPDGSIG